MTTEIINISRRHIISIVIINVLVHVSVHRAEFKCHKKDDVSAELSVIPPAKYFDTLRAGNNGNDIKTPN